MNKSGDINQILLVTRWLAGVVLPFLVTAFVILFIFPNQTEKLFAWKIQPAMSAMMLGAAYAGGIWFFAGVLRSHKWSKVKVGFLPVIVFATLLGVTTILHWDRFNHQHISFFAWAGLYFTTPFLVFASWFLNKNQDHGAIEQGEKIIPDFVRLLMGLFGGLTLLVAGILFLLPDLIIDQWPWALTPLTARVMGAMFSLPGLVGLGVAFDRRWSAANLILQSQGVSILLILIGAARSTNEFNWINPGSWIFVGGLGVMLLAICLLLVFVKK